MKLDRLPTPIDLMDHPQLSALIALDTTLLVAMRALLAVHTDLLDDVFPRTITEQDYWAGRMLDIGYEMEKVIEKYRAALLERNTSGEEDF